MTLVLSQLFCLRSGVYVFYRFKLTTESINTVQFSDSPWFCYLNSNDFRDFSYVFKGVEDTIVITK